MMTGIKGMKNGKIKIKLLKKNGMDNVATLAIQNTKP